MSLSTKQKRFIKLDVNGNLFGSLKYDLTPTELGIWDRLLLIAKLSSTEGVILKSEWQDDAISTILNLTPYGGIELLKSTIKKLVKTDRVQVLSDGSYNIINWHKFQDTPEWVARTRENYQKAISRRDKQLKEEKNKALEPSDNLISVADKLDNVAKRLGV
jgi:hypothetical protein